MAYLLDADVFIRAKNLHYGFDFCPAFWTWIVEAHQKGVVYSIEKVGNELHAGADDLADWAAARDEAFFLPPDEESIPALSTVSNWVMSQKYEPSAIDTFLQKADYYLVAQALSGRHIVVTHEVPSNSVKRIKIPDACIGMRVKCMSPYEMLRSERARFVLGRDKKG